MTAFCGYFGLYYLQVCRYKILDFVRAVFRCREGIVCLVCGIVSLGLGIIFPNTVDIFTPILTFLSGLCGATKKRKVKFRFTKRILRLFIAEIVLSCGFCMHIPHLIPLVILPVIILSWALTLPIEKVIARYYITKAKGKLENMAVTKIAITGSYGKTGVKNILTRLLSTKYITSCAPLSYNTPLGIADYINNTLTENTEIAVFEFGARNRGDISQLAEIVKPNHAIVTAVGGVHLKTFGSIEEITREKTSLFSYIDSNNFCVVGKTVDISAVDRADIIVCETETAEEKSEVGENRCFAKNIAVSLEGTTFTIVEQDGETNCATALMGKHNVENILLAYAMARVLGCDKKLLTEEISKLTPTPHRQELIRNGNITIIDDSYNANISGVKALSDTLSLFPSPKIVITQGIVEGGKSQKEQNVEVGKILAKSVDYALICGKNSDDIAFGLKTGGMSSENVSVLKDLNQCVKRAREIIGEKGVICFQNDLPDLF